MDYGGLTCAVVSISVNLTKHTLLSLPAFFVAEGYRSASVCRRLLLNKISQNAVNARMKFGENEENSCFETT